MTTIVTAAEVFSDSDPNRAVVTISRKGGDGYRTEDAAGNLVDHKSYADAVAFAEKVADEKTLTELASSAYKDEQIADLRAAVKDLQDQLAAKG